MVFSRKRRLNALERIYHLLVQSCDIKSISICKVLKVDLIGLGPAARRTDNVKRGGGIVSVCFYFPGQTIFDTLLYSYARDFHYLLGRENHTTKVHSPSTIISEYVFYFYKT